MELSDLFDTLFFRNAMIGAILASIACGMIGTYIVVRRLAFISGGITHASFGGLGAGFYLGIDPILSALVFSVASALGIEWLSQRQDVRKDSAIAVFWSLGMALGVILIFLRQGFAPSMEGYLFGSILTITTTEIYSLLGLCGLLACVFLFFGKTILYTAFDREFARTRKMPVRFTEYAMMCLIAITIVLSINLIGIVLLMSMLTVPQMTANLFTNNFRKMIWGSILIGFVGCLSGLILTVYINVPSGAFIIFVQIMIFLLCKLALFFVQQIRRKQTLSS